MRPRIKKASYGYVCYHSRFVPINYRRSIAIPYELVTATGRTPQEAYAMWLEKHPEFEQRWIRSSVERRVKERLRKERMKVVRALLGHEAIPLIGILALVAYIIFG